jgi:RimJ/RimL family protein N-acetyltransferase
MILRPATWDDSERLLSWRNDAQTVANSIEGASVSPEAHTAWMLDGLKNPKRALLIAMVRGNVPAGTVRIDGADNGSSCEMSWTVAPEWRGQKLGKQMVKLGVEKASKQYPLILAQIRPGNIASLLVAQHAGFRKLLILDGIDLWAYEGKSSAVP